MKILIETSARHVHLSKNALEKLFGEGYELTPKRFLSQPGQFLCEEKVEIKGPKNSIKNVSILGPLRNKTQVELSMTDTINLGIDGKIRESGDLIGSSDCEIISKNGKYKVNEGVIIAKRHIHMTEKDAKEFSVKNGDIVCIKVDSLGRSLIFDDVVVRVSEEFSLACHIDTDESNACGLKKGTFGELITKNKK